MPIVSTAVGFFCCNKFDETPNEKMVNMSKLTKSYFKFINYEITSERNDFRFRMKKIAIYTDLTEVKRLFFHPKCIEIQILLKVLL